LLLIGGLGMQHLQVVLVSRSTAGNVALVALDEFVYSLFWAERCLEDGAWTCGGRP
jgi:hypothetical protein